jgi:hypothetical protein
MIEFPRTLEDILVWKLEQSNLVISFYAMLCSGRIDYRPTASIYDDIQSWLKDIVHLEGAVTTNPVDISSSSSTFCHRPYRVYVAGVLICSISQTERNFIYEHGYHQYLQSNP